MELTAIQKAFTSIFSNGKKSCANTWLFRVLYFVFNFYIIIDEWMGGCMDCLQQLISLN